MPNGIVTAAMAKTDAREQLRRVPLFRGLSNDELQQLSQLVKEQSYKAGAPIVEEGQTGLGLYVIRSGRASVTKQGRTINHIGPNDFFGEIAVLGGGPRTASVIADEDTVCYTLASWEIKPLLNRNAGLTYKMLVEVVNRLRDDSGPAD
jgi:CRP-like cAMP-binding protein